MSEKEKEHIEPIFLEMARELKQNSKIKDTLFSLIVKERKFLLEIYKSIHPEDVTAGEEDVELVNIEPLFFRTVYNDMAILVRKRLLILIEDQSTWTENIKYRLMEYYTKLYSVLDREYGRKRYRRKPLDFPEFELCVFYTGNEVVPEKLYLTEKKEVYDERGNIPVRVYTKYNIDGFAKEIFLFSDVFDKNRSLYGLSPRSIEETIAECLSKGILVELIEKKRYELEECMKGFDVVSIARTMQDYADEIREKAEEEGEARGKAEGIAEGKAEGITEGEARGEVRQKELMEKRIRSLDFPDSVKNFLLSGIIG